MSYYFDMGFAEAKSIGDAMEMAQRFVGRMTKVYVCELIERNIIYVPSLRLSTSFKDKSAANIVDTYWLYSLLNFQFVFWPEYHLLGMVGDDPRAKEAGFEMVAFQNSTDQNYELGEWPKTIPFFQARVNQTALLLKEQPDVILKHLAQQGFDLDDCGFDDLETGAEYLVLTSLYKQIFRDLELDAWLYGREPDTPGKFQRFALNAITTSERKMDYGLILRSVKRKFAK